MRWLTNVAVEGEKVLLRLDLDLPPEGKSFDTTRLEDSFETLTYLWREKATHVTVIAHRGHDPKPTAEFSLNPIAKILYEKLLTAKGWKKVTRPQLEAWLDVLENLRFDPREEQISPEFAKELASDHTLFVNDAFATSHREHTSIVGIPKLLPTVFGCQFEKEMAVMKRLTEHPKRPFVFVLGGAKLETKLPLLEKMMESVDVILLGGKLAVEAREKGYKNRRMIIASVTEDTLDITPAASEQFERFIIEAKTLLWNGPMGYFEDGKHTAGTHAIIQAVMKNTGGFKVAGGGDTEAALTQFKVNEKKIFSFISSGGGAMLHYLAYRTLPAIEAVKK